MIKFNTIISEEENIN